jgi:hypothetical protein
MNEIRFAWVHEISLSTLSEHQGWDFIPGCKRPECSLNPIPAETTSVYEVFLLIGKQTAITGIFDMHFCRMNISKILARNTEP